MPANPSIPTAPPTPAPIERAAVRIALVAGLFCGLLAAGMLFLHVRSKLDDPLKAPHMAALKDQLSTSPKDEQLKQHIRESDLELRRSYFRQLTMKGAGGWMLLIGLCAFLLAAKKVHQLRQRPRCRRSKRILQRKPCKRPRMPAGPSRRSALCWPSASPPSA